MIHVIVMQSKPKFLIPLTVRLQSALQQADIRSALLGYALIAARISCIPPHDPIVSAAISVAKGMMFSTIITVYHVGRSAYCKVVEIVQNAYEKRRTM